MYFIVICPRLNGKQGGCQKSRGSFTAKACGFAADEVLRPMQTIPPKEVLVGGNIKRMIDRILELRAHGNPILLETTRAKLIFKGINPDTFSEASPEDPKVEAKIREIAADWGVFL
jgi:hypothetical protein